MDLITSIADLPPAGVVIIPVKPAWNHLVSVAFTTDYGSLSPSDPVKPGKPIYPTKSDLLNISILEQEIDGSWSDWTDWSKSILNM